MCRSLSLRAQASRAILLLSLCNETRRGLNQGKFSWICHSEPFDFAQDKLRRGISNSRSDRQEKTIVIPHQRETPLDMTNVILRAVWPAHPRSPSRVRLFFWGH